MGKGGTGSVGDGDQEPQAEVVVAVKDRDEMVIILPNNSSQDEKGAPAGEAKPDKEMVPGVGRVGRKLRMLNVPLDVFPSSVEEFMVHLPPHPMLKRSSGSFACTAQLTLFDLGAASELPLPSVQHFHLDHRCHPHHPFRLVRMSSLVSSSS
jgi:hypothetical protein